MTARSGERCRLDQVLVERGLVPTRTKAQALILAGRVRSGDRTMDKPGVRVDREIVLAVDDAPRDVGRGAVKLRGALHRFALDLAGRVVLDVGASTGGFTQVALESGASHVLAVDVGRGQLDWTLRNDPRVTPIEGVNARYLSPQDLPVVPDCAVIDVSFISVERILPAVTACLPPNGSDVVCLVKPQFEVGREHVPRGGIVRDGRLHRSSLTAVAEGACGLGWSVRAMAPSPIRGAEGNLEFFLHLRRDAGGARDSDLDSLAGRAVDEAHREDAT